MRHFLAICALGAALGTASTAQAADFCQFWAVLTPADQSQQVRHQLLPVLKAEPYGLKGIALQKAVRCLINANETIRELNSGQCPFDSEGVNAFVTELTQSEGGITDQCAEAGEDFKADGIPDLTEE